MRLIELTQSRIPLDELLSMVSRETVILRKPDSRGFVLAAIDDFDLEIHLLRNNKEFMAYLDELSDQEATISLEEVEKELGL